MITTIHDVLYGCIELQPLVIAHIIQTPLFQRLKQIKQLGVLPLVVPNANHTRYDHCIGTFHQARKMLNALERNSGDRCVITQQSCWSSYRLAVEIAALLHDIGHGPFSHTWERVVDGFHHEANGIACIDEIFKELPELPVVFQTDAPYWINLIKSLIVGKIPSSLPTEYKFIFEIMNNERCGVDVDKWDYLLRDNYCLPEDHTVPIQFDDIFLNARIAEDGSCIEYRYADYGLINDLFVARQIMHFYCYRRPANEICTYLLTDLVKKCNSTICDLKLNAINSSNLNAFLQLTDAKVLDAIKDQPKYKYLRNHDDLKITEIDCHTETKVETTRLSDNSTNTDNILNGTCKTINVHNIMPVEEKFQFYGNASDKPKIPPKSSPWSYTFHFTFPWNVCNDF